MSRRMRVLMALLAPLAVLMLIAPAARADVQMIMQNTPSGSYDSIYTSPYQLNVGGSNGQQNGVNMLLFCDDFSDEVGIGSTWMADVIQGSDTAALHTTRMAYEASQDPLAKNEDIVTLYDEKAWFEMNFTGADIDHYSRAYVFSYAIWNLFEPTAVKGYLASDSAFYSAVTDAMAMPNNYVGLHNSLTIYSPQDAKGWTTITSGPYSGLVPQEYDRVPDGGVTLMLLGGALVGLE